MESSYRGDIDYYQDGLRIRKLGQILEFFTSENCVIVTNVATDEKNTDNLMNSKTLGVCDFRL